MTDRRVSASSSETGPPRNLVTSDVTDAGFTASWTAAPGNVKTYHVKWKSLFSEESGKTTVAGDVTSAVLTGLSPETLFQVSVVAKYEDGDSEALAGQETTDGIASTSSYCHLKLCLLRVKGHMSGPGPAPGTMTFRSSQRDVPSTLLSPFSRCCS